MTFETWLRWSFYAISALALSAILIEAVYRWRHRPTPRFKPEPVEHVQEGEV